MTSTTTRPTAVFVDVAEREPDATELLAQTAHLAAGATLTFCASMGDMSQAEHEALTTQSPEQLAAMLTAIGAECRLRAAALALRSGPAALEATGMSLAVTAATREQAFAGLHAVLAQLATGTVARYFAPSVSPGASVLKWAS